MAAILVNGLWPFKQSFVLLPQGARRLHMKFEQYRPRGFRGGHLKLATFFPYKCMGPIQMHTEVNLTLPQKGQTLIYDHHFSNFGRLPSRWFVQRFSLKASFVLEKKIFKGFYHIWAWWPSWSMDSNHFSNQSFIPLSQGDSKWNLSTITLAPRLHRRSCLKFSTFSHTNA